MTERKVIPATPGPLEDYAAQFDDLWAKAAQRECFRAYLKACCCPETGTRLSLLDAQGKLDWSQAFLDGSFVPEKGGRGYRLWPERQR